MKICLVTPAYKDKTSAGGGIGVYFATQAEGLSQQGHEVHVLIAGAKESREYQEKGIHFHEFKMDFPAIFKIETVADRFPFQEFLLIRKASKVLSQLNKKYGFDMIETTSLSALCFFYLRKPHKTPVVTRVVTTLEMTMKYKRSAFSKKERIIFWLEKRAIQLSDYLVTHTHAHRSELCSQLNLNEDDFSIIPLGVPVPKGGAESKKSSFQNTVLYVGRMEARKGTDVLLKAVPQVLAKAPATRFVFVGYDHRNKYENDFRKNCDPLTGNAVFFAGEVSDQELQDWYAACDMLVAPSLYESFGLMYVEAMLHEKPVIGCRASGGAAEIIRDEMTGLLTEAENPADLSEKIISLARNEKLRSELGAAGKVRALKNYAQEVFVTRMVNFYQKILKEKKSRRGFVLDWSKAEESQPQVKVSIIIPTYNRPEMLGRALESIKAQTFSGYEVFVIQNGPFRSAQPVVESFHKNGMSISYLHTETPGGANARNMGLQHARGEFVAFLDDDDEWGSQKLKKETDFLDSHPDTAMVFSHPVLVYSDGKMKPDSPKVLGVPAYKDLIEHGCLIRSFSGVMIRKECLDRVGLLNTHYQIGNDFDLYLRIARHFKLGMISEPLYRYSVHSLNFSKNIQLGFEEFIAALKQQSPAAELGVTAVFIKKAIQKYYRHYCGAADDASDAKQFERALKFYLKGLSHNPFIGIQIKWGRFDNPFYHFVRPYFAVFRCFFMVLKEKMMLKSGVS